MGDGTTNRSSPAQVKGPGGTGTLANVVQVALGNYFQVARTSDGSVYVWGAGDFGQPGDGTRTFYTTPHLNPTLSMTSGTPVVLLAGGFAPNGKPLEQAVQDDVTPLLAQPR